MTSVNIDALAATLVLLTQKALVLTSVKNKLNLYRLYKFKHKFKHRRTLYTYILFGRNGWAGRVKRTNAS